MDIRIFSNKENADEDREAVNLPSWNSLTFTAGPAAHGSGVVVHVHDVNTYGLSLASNKVTFTIDQAGRLMQNLEKLEKRRDPNLLKYARPRQPTYSQLQQGQQQQQQQQQVQIQPSQDHSPNLIPPPLMATWPATSKPQQPQPKAIPVAPISSTRRTRANTRSLVATATVATTTTQTTTSTTTTTTKQSPARSVEVLLDAHQTLLRSTSSNQSSSPSSSSSSSFKAPRVSKVTLPVTSPIARPTAPQPQPATQIPPEPQGPRATVVEALRQKEREIAEALARLRQHMQTQSQASVDYLKSLGTGFLGNTVLGSGARPDGGTNVNISNYTNARTHISTTATTPTPTSATNNNFVAISQATSRSPLSQPATATSIPTTVPTPVQRATPMTTVSASHQPPASATTKATTRTVVAAARVSVPKTAATPTQTQTTAPKTMPVISTRAACLPPAPAPASIPKSTTTSNVFTVPVSTRPPHRTAILPPTTKAPTMPVPALTTATATPAPASASVTPAPEPPYAPVIVSSDFIKKTAEGRMLVFVSIKPLLGNLYLVETGRSETIGCLKRTLHRKYGIPEDQQRFSFAGKLLEDHLTLGHYNIQREATLQLTKRR